jgi:hypothetical protein
MRILLARVAQVCQLLAPPAIFPLTSQPPRARLLSVSSPSERTTSSYPLRPEIHSLEHWLDLNA